MSDTELAGLIDMDNLESYNLDPVNYDDVGPNPHRATIDPAYNTFLTLVAAGESYELAMKPGEVVGPEVETYALVRISTQRFRAIILDHPVGTHPADVRYIDSTFTDCLYWLRINTVPVLIAKAVGDYVRQPSQPLSE